MMLRKKLILLLLILSISSHVKSQDLVIEHGNLKIGGTLEVSESYTKGDPLVILISGSGAQDRDESIFGFKPFKVVAEHLLEQGISSFRYDDREVGASNGNFSETPLDELANDVRTIMDYFQFQSAQWYDSFILLGHSQGGVVATKVANNDDRISGIILMASPTVPMKDVINEQVALIQKASGKTEEDIQSVLSFQEKAYETARTNAGWDELKKDYQHLIERELSKLPEAQQQFIVDIEAFATAQFNAQVSPMQSAQMRSLLFYNPIKDLEGIEVEILALFGGKDTQVTPSQNEPILQELCEEDRMKCTIKNFPDANHLFQKANSGFVNEYGMLPKAFIDGFLDEISGWIEKEL